MPKDVPFWVNLAFLGPAALALAAPALSAQVAAEPRAAVVVHEGDTGLRDLLIAQGEVWSDAGDFLVGRWTQEELHGFEQGGIAAWLLDLDPCEELFLLPGTAESAAGARVLHRGRGQRLIGVATGMALPGGAQAHCGPVQVPRIGMRPAAPVPQVTLGLTSAVPRIQATVLQVDSQNIMTRISSLAALTTRRATRPEATVAQGMIEGWLQQLGLTTSLQSFGSQYSRNVVAELPGALTPQRYIVLGAHYDSINGSSSTAPAPGADDNASGTAGVLEAARVLVAGGPYESTIRFVLFSGEEFGLLGSAEAAQRSVTAGENIVAMLNMDMIAYRSGSDVRDVDFATNNTNSSLTTQCRQIGALYVPGWASVTGVLTAGTSDHQSYNSRGFPAAFFFEDLVSYCPWIHTSQDAYPAATNDPELAKMIVQGVVAAAATLAVPWCAPATNYCVGAPNSVGAGAVMSSQGSTSLSANDLVLQVLGCPPNKAGLFYWGSAQAQAPLGNGYRCASTNVVRFPITTTNSFGDASHAVDVTALAGGQVLQSGDVRHAQFWYRDPAAGGTNYNLSNGRRLAFCP